MKIDPQLLAQLDRPVPRYTSYPTALQFVPLDESLFTEKATSFPTDRPLSIYIHIPFCRSMCLFCACSVILNRNEEVQSRYFSYLLQEIALVSSKFHSTRTVTQLHLGGGTPTNLTHEQFTSLMAHLRAHFHFSPDAELSIEVDPRTVSGHREDTLALLRALGFNRISFGVQDLDSQVQEAIKRRQSEEMTVTTYWRARELQFTGINIDLIYGLPFQTRASFSRTVERLISLRPDRIALYSYAKVPWLKPHQKAIPDASLPSTEEKFAIYLVAREAFCAAGYHPIGMDHFALPTDPLTSAHLHRQLTRNFQGYSVALAEDLIGFGVTSIGFLDNCYFQNGKDLTHYQSCLQHGRLPIIRGFLLQHEDLIRRFVIQSLMCHFLLDKRSFQHHFSIDFDSHFHHLQPQLQSLIHQALLLETSEFLQATSLGAWFIRLLAAPFDAYFQPGACSKVV